MNRFNSRHPIYAECLQLDSLFHSEQENTVADNKRIAKNTMFLYFRMILIMGVTLYTSRVILDKLGIEDYGLYQVVGGVVGVLSFLNGTLSTGTSRFLTYELGVGDGVKQRLTFSTAFYTHAILAFTIILLMETGGLWFFYNKLVIPEERLTACFWVFQLSLLMSLILITQVPYTASIMAHECMEIYALLSIFEAIAKLGICYLLSYSTFDRLILYAFLLLIVQLLVAFYYRAYCIRNFSECKLSMTFDKSVLKNMLGFSGWNVMAELSNTFSRQGTLILLNMFFSPVVVASQAIAAQVSNAVDQFVRNFRVAINPQIIKLHASGKAEESRRLTLSTTVLCFDLILLLGLPAIVVMNEIMHLWLVEVPEYAVIFTQLIIVRQVIDTFNASLYTPMLAANEMSVNSVAAFVISLVTFVMLYVVFRLGFSPIWTQYLSILTIAVFSFVVKPYVLISRIGYTYIEMRRCYWTCLKTLGLACLLAILPIYYFNDSLTDSLFKVISVCLAVLISSFLFLEKHTRKIVKQVIISRLNIKSSKSYEK